MEFRRQFPCPLCTTQQMADMIELKSPPAPRVAMTRSTSNVVPPGDLETNGPVISCIRVFTVPLLNALPGSVIKKMMNHSSRDASEVVARGGSTHALEAMYTRYHRRLFSRGPLHGLADSFWHHVVAQPKALRNRLKIVRQILKTEATRLIRERRHRGSSEPIRILSIAGGSSRSIIQTVVDLKMDGLDYPVEVVVVDKDQSALDIGEQIARQAAVGTHFQWVCAAAWDIKDVSTWKTFDLIEIVGLMDYLSEVRAVKLIKGAQEVLNDGGAVVAANVIPNPEMRFVHKTGWPRMVYRSPSAFRALFDACGFAKTEITVDPLKVHCVAIARK